jgi:hypothetical protein
MLTSVGREHDHADTHEADYGSRQVLVVGSEAVEEDAYSSEPMTNTPP